MFKFSSIPSKLSGVPGVTVKSIPPSLPPKQETSEVIALSAPGVNSVKSIIIDAGIIGHPKAFDGVRVSVTGPVVIPSGVQVTVCGVLAGAVAVPSIAVELKTPTFGEAVQSPTNVSETYPSKFMASGIS